MSEWGQAAYIPGQLRVPLPTEVRRAQFSLSSVAVVQPLSRVQLFCDPVDCSPPGSSVHGISQARTLEWAAIILLQGIFPTQELNPVSPALAGEFFTDEPLLAYQNYIWGTFFFFTINIVYFHLYSFIFSTNICIVSVRNII